MNMDNNCFNLLNGDHDLFNSNGERICNVHKCRRSKNLCFMNSYYICPLHLGMSAFIQLDLKNANNPDKLKPLNYIERSD